MSITPTQKKWLKDLASSPNGQGLVAPSRPCVRASDGHVTMIRRTAEALVHEGLAAYDADYGYIVRITDAGRELVGVPAPVQAPVDPKVGDTVKVVFPSGREGADVTGVIGRISDYFVGEFAFENDPAVLYPVAWITEVVPAAFQMQTCPTCHEPLDLNTLELMADGTIPPEGDCLDCFHLHQFGKKDVTAADYAAAGWEVPEGLVLAGDAA